MKSPQKYVTAAFTGALIGDLIWSLALIGALAFELFEKVGPNWLSRLDVYDTFGTICIVIAFPVAIGGWLFVWGDNGPPHSWINSIVFNICFGLVFYAALGAAVGALIAKKYHWAISTRTMLIAFTVIILAIGLAITSRF